MSEIAALQHPARPRVKVPVWPIVLVIYATLLPREISIHVGENYIYMDRLALLFTVPMILQSLWRGAIKFVLPDWLILALACWIILATLVVHGLRMAMVTGFSLSFDAVAGYYLARISFRSLDDMRRALILCAPGFFIAASSVMIESISHQPLVRPFFASVFGNLHYSRGATSVEDVIPTDVRLGLMRGSGPWVHPILAGLHLSTLLSVYWMSGIRGWPRVIALTAASMSFFAMSSSGLLSLSMQIFLLSYDWLCGKVREINWRWFTTAAGALIVVMQVVVNRGIDGLIIAFATLDPTTGYFRQAIWTYGMQSVYRHPLFGIGFNDYVRPQWMFSNSVDAHWLLYAMRYGLPSTIFLLSACIAAIVALVRSEAHASKGNARFYRGIIIGFSVLILMGFTVAYQGGTLTWFTLLLGGCVACAQHGFTVRRPAPVRPPRVWLSA